MYDDCDEYNFEPSRMGKLRWWLAKLIIRVAAWTQRNKVMP